MRENTRYPQLHAARDKALTVTRKQVGNFPLHWHDFFEIEVVVAGQGTHVLNGKEYPLARGSAYLLKPTDYHEIRHAEGLELYNVTFLETMLGEAQLMALLHSANRAGQVLAGDALQGALLALELLALECEKESEHTKAFLAYLVSLFLDSHGGRGSKEQLVGINRALALMEVRFREPLTLAQVAREAGFHPTYFSELFKATTGESFLTRLNTLRLEYACILLKDGHAVSYACFESGFGSLSNFTAAFRRRYGISPGKYAKTS